MRRIVLAVSALALSIAVAVSVWLYVFGPYLARYVDDAVGCLIYSGSYCR